MSNRDTDEQLGLKPSPSLFPLKSSSSFATGFSLAGVMSGRPTSAPATRDQAWSTGTATAPHQRSDVNGPFAIEFRVTRDGSPARRLRLTGRRYTFGSGEGCSIRLSDTSLRPMHAVLIRDEHRILIRAYSVPILVNGNRTTEATLAIGDLLQLGSYRLELLGLEGNTRPAQAADPDDDLAWNENAFKLRFADSPSLTSSRSGLASLGRETTDRAAALAAEESVWREQLRREVEQWRMAKAECERRENRCDDRESNMRQRESELWNRSEVLRRREAELKAQESAILEIQDEYEAKKQSLARLQAEDRKRREEFQRREAEFERLEQEYKQQIEQVTEQLKRSQDQASTANEAVQRMRGQFNTLNTQLADLTAKQAELRDHNEEKSAELRRTRQELERARDEAILQRNQAIADRDSLASQTGQLVAERDQAVAQRQAALAECEQAIRDRDEAENQCVQAIRNRDESVEQRNIAQRERDAVIDERAKSDALRIQLSSDLALANERLADVERELAASQQLIEQGDQSTQSWKRQVIDLQESVATAKNETRLLRDEYEAACESISRLEALVSEQSRHSSEAKDSWLLEAEHLRLSFEGVSRDLAVALAELGQLRETNTEFSNQLEAVRAEKARVESELESRPTQDAWSELQVELDRATESLQIIQRDYDATLAELNTLRDELHDERQWASERAPQASERAPHAVADLAPRHDADEPSVADELSVAAESSMADELGVADEPSMADEPSVAAEPSAADESAVSQGWSTPIYPLDSPAAETPRDEFVEPDASTATPQSESWNWPAEHADSESNAEPTASDHGDVVADAEADAPVGAQADAEEAGLSFGSLAQQLIADIDHDQPAPPKPDKRGKRSIVNELHDEDRENEEFFEATAVHDSFLAASRLDESDIHNDSADANAWDADDSGEVTNDRTVVGSDIGMQFGLAPDTDDDEQAIEPTSLWSQTHNERDSYDDTPTGEQYDDQQYNGERYNDELAYDEHGGNHTSHEYLEGTADSHDDAPQSDSRIWTSDSDSVVMESELVASDTDDVDAPHRHEMENDDRDLDASHEPHVEDAPVAAAPAEQEPIEDDSIEAYMNRLLQRVQGGKTPTGDAPETVTPPVSKTTATVPPENSVLKPKSLPSEPVADAGEESPDTPMVPRSQAPERNANLNAMRQLANESARTAINRSVKIQSRDTQLKAFAKFGSALGLMVCALAVFLFTHFPGTAIIACCMCVVAVVWVNEGLKLLGVARRRVSLAAAGKLEQEEADEARAGAE